MAIGLACHMLVYVCLLGNNLYVYAKPEKKCQIIKRTNWHLKPSPEG